MNEFLLKKTACARPLLKCGLVLFMAIASAQFGLANEIRTKPLISESEIKNLRCIVRQLTKEETGIVHGNGNFEIDSSFVWFPGASLLVFGSESYRLNRSMILVEAWTKDEKLVVFPVALASKDEYSSIVNTTAKYTLAPVEVTMGLVKGIGFFVYNGIRNSLTGNFSEIFSRSALIADSSKEGYVANIFLSTPVLASAAIRLIVFAPAQVIENKIGEAQARDYAEKSTAVALYDIPQCD